MLDSIDFEGAPAGEQSSQSNSDWTSQLGGGAKKKASEQGQNQGGHQQPNKKQRKKQNEHPTGYFEDDQTGK